MQNLAWSNGIKAIRSSKEDNPAFKKGRQFGHGNYATATASGTAASGTAATGTAASGTAATGTAASGTAATGTAASGTAATATGTTATPLKLSTTIQSANFFTQ